MSILHLSNSSGILGPRWVAQWIWLCKSVAILTDRISFLLPVRHHPSGFWGCQAWGKLWMMARSYAIYSRLSVISWGPLYGNFRVNTGAASSSTALVALSSCWLPRQPGSLLFDFMGSEWCLAFPGASRRFRISCLFLILFPSAVKSPHIAPCICTVAKA